MEFTGKLLKSSKLEELGELEPAILENEARLNACDVVCYTYDSSDPDSFAYIVDLRVHTLSLKLKLLFVDINLHY